MTEEIIIDGVNVAGCEFYLQDDKYSCDLSFINQEELCKCDDVQDCTYKQLKRLEQENKKLKKEVKQIGSDFIKKGDYARELEQENRELKAYKDINEDFKKAWDELNKKHTEVLKLAKENADSNEYCLQELEQENKSLYEEKNCLHKIIDRLLENSGYSKDIASAEDFEDVYEDMQRKRNELIELEQENKKLKKDVQLFKCLDTFGESECHCACRCLGNEFCEDADKKINTYRSTLEEIREIAERELYLKQNSSLIKIIDRINEAL